MKKALLFVLMLWATQLMHAGVIKFENFRNSRTVQNGVLLQASYTPVDEDDENGIVISNNKLEIPARSTVTINTGCVNIKKIVLHLYSGSDVPHLKMTATEGSVETVKEPAKTVTWTNTGKAVANVVLTLVETETASDVQYEFQKNRVQRAPDLANMWRFGESSSRGESMKAPVPFPVPYLLPLFHWPVLTLYSFRINWCSSK